MALATLGMFVFETGTLPFASLDRQTDWRYAQAERFDARAATQFIGQGEDKITLAGVLVGGQIGDYAALTRIRSMADAGESYPLVDGIGRVLGNWFIRSLKETQTLFFVDGVQRKSDFSLDLERASEDTPDGSAANG